MVEALGQALCTFGAVVWRPAVIALAMDQELGLNVDHSPLPWKDLHASRGSQH
jgi:hypothetical protein